MKSITFISILFLVQSISFAQIHGDGNIKTITTNLEGLIELDVQFNADIILDYDVEETMTITADENILAYIGQDFKKGKLTLDQIKWIEPSKQPKITIGCPKLAAVYQGTHSKTTIINVDAQQLELGGNVGNLEATGVVKSLSVNTTGTDIDLSKLKVERAEVSIDDDSEVILNDVSVLETKLSDDAQLKLLSEIKNYSKPENPNALSPEARNAYYANADYIDFKIKNNSWKRNHFVVVGPKKDGGKFSYGFSLLPGYVKEERWTIGTKVYKEKRSGAKELLVTIEAKDESQTVNLFK